MSQSPQQRSKLAVVIGAGVAGCQAARACIRAGYECLLLEEGESVGGVWRRNYHGYALQVPHSFFTFPEYPYAAAPPELRRRAEAEVYPTGPLVQEYIASYCARFRLQRHLVLGARVLHIGSQPGGRWAVRYRQLPGGGAQLAPSHAHASTASTASGMAPSPRAQPGPAAAVAAAAAAALGGPQQAQQAQQAGEAAGVSAGVSRQPTHADSFLMGTQGHVGALGEEEGQGREVEVVADVVVCATGMYYTPYVPPIPGLASFTGPALHVRDFPSLDLVRGKRVLVVGAGKSALDAAVAAASAAAGAAAVTSLFRAAHWPLPRRVLGLPFQRVLYTRFAAAMLPPYYTAQGRPSKALRHALLAPLKALFWRALQADVAARMGLRGPLKPGRGFVEDMFYGGQIQDGSWNEAVRSGCISAVQGHLAAVTPGGVRLADGRELGCDVIIFATGYTKDYSLLDPDTLRRLTAAGGEGEGAGGGAHAAEATDAAGKHGASGRKGADGAAPGAEGEGDGGQAGAGRGGGGGGRGGSVDGDAGSSGAGAGAEGEGVHLYRSMLCPGVPNLYFIGSEAASLNNVLTSGLQSLWLLHRLTAALALPSEQDMEQDIAAQRRWRRRVMPAQRHSSAVIILYQQRYHDQLVADMGHDPHRKRAAARRGRHPAAATSAAAAGAADALLSAPPGQPTSDDDGAAASRAASDAAAAAAGRYRLPHGVAVGSRAGGGGGGGGGGEAFGMYMAEDYADLFADDAIPGLPVGPAAPPPARSAAEILAAMATLAPTVSAALPSPSAMEAAAQQADSDPPSWGKEPPSTADKGNARQYASGRALLHGAGGTSSTGGDPAGGGGGGEAGRNSAGPGKDPASRRRGENSSGGTGDTVPAGAPNAYGELPTGASRPDA